MHQTSLLLQFGKSVNKFFPQMSEWLRTVKDSRQSGKCTYTIESLLWLSLLLLLSPLSSRRQYNQEMNELELKACLEGLLGIKLPAIPHGDTLNNLWSQMCPSELEKLKQLMVKVLIRGKYLDTHRYKKTWLVAIDGVELYRFNEKHCEHCLYAKINGKYQYYHRVLEAKLVCGNGLVISMASEFIENNGQDVDNKQDCELKAFHRLAARLKQVFPKLPITVLADSLYPNGPVFERCREYDWKYIFVLQSKVLPSVWEDFKGLCQMPLNALGVKEKDNCLNTKTDEYWWQNDLEYQGQKFKGKLNLMTVTSQEKKQLKRAFVTNWAISVENVTQLECQGQMRWKIENEGFNVQKNHGFNLEHSFSRNPNAQQCVYQLIQMAHLLFELFQRADLLQAGQQLHSRRQWQQWLYESLFIGWNDAIERTWLLLKQQPIQWRTG